MHGLAQNNTVERTGRTNLQARKFLAIAILVSLFALSFSITNHSTENPKKIFAREGVGLSPEGTGCVSRHQYDQNKAYYDSIGRPRCPDRPANPEISVQCPNPELTVALMVDRSNSVIGEGTSQTPAVFKQSVDYLINQLYDRFSTANGKLNFLIYAFASKSVLQNPTTDDKTPVLESNLITDASTPAGRQAMIDTIEKIHFRDEEHDSQFTDKNYPNSDRDGFQHDGTLWGKQRAYNLGSEKSPGEYGNTNWHDAFSQIARAQYNSKYNDSASGKNIGLAVMLTDGLPTREDGWDYKWDAGTYKGLDTISYTPDAQYNDIAGMAQYNKRYTARDDLYRIPTEKEAKWYAQQVIDALRDGRKIGTDAVGIGKRPPMSVRGIIVRTTKDQAEISRSKSIAKEVFGKDNYYFATGFDQSLKDQINTLVTDVIAGSGCGDLAATPKLEITTDRSDEDPANTVSPVEGNPSGDALTITVTNRTDGPLNDVKICIGGTVVEGKCIGGTAISISDRMEQGESEDIVRTFVANYGDVSDHDITLTAFGTSTADKITSGASKYPTATIVIHVRPQRQDFPA